MSGFCLESFHLSEALSECAFCFPIGSRHYAADEDEDDVMPGRAETLSNHNDYARMHQLPAGDYLDSCARRISETMLASMPAERSTSLSVDILLDMTPILNGQDVIQLAARHLLLSYVKSRDNVHHVFFPGHQTKCKYGENIDQKSFDFDHLACLYVCQAICKVKDEYELHLMLNDSKIEGELQSLYSSPHWKKLGFSLYTMLFEELLKDEHSKIPFSAYLDDDRQAWARQLSDRVRQKEWIYPNLINPLVQGKCTSDMYNRDLNILFIKLHLLDPATVMPTYDYLRRVLPDLNLELVTTNYLGGPLDWSLIKHDIERAIQKTTYPNKRRQLTFGNVEVFYGVEVLEFIMSEAKDRQLWTGRYPDNRRLSELSERCIVM